MEILELFLLTGILIDYDSQGHVPSDIGTHQQFSPPGQFSMQSKLDEDGQFPTMKLNSSKSNYMIFSRSQEVFATRLAINDQTIKQKEAAKSSVSGFPRMLGIGKGTLRKFASRSTQGCQC